MHFCTRARILLILTVSLFGLTLGACTREREPWPESQAGPAVEQPESIPSVTPTANATAFPVFTPHITAEVAEIEAGVSTPVPSEAEATNNEVVATPTAKRGLPPMPEAKELTPRPPTPLPDDELFPYKVRAGDSLYSIAVEFNITVDDIKRYNEIEDPNTLRTGTVLKLPGEPPEGTNTGDGYIHVVKAGETLFAIAMQYGVPLNELASTNDITNPSTIRTGQRLIIPIAAENQGNSNDVRVHIVQPGDTLSSIAVQYGVTPAAIMQANDLENANRIFSGQKLTIPN